MQKIIKGIIGAIIGALLFFFVGGLFIADNSPINIYSILFITVGAASGFFVGYVEKKKNSNNKEMFFAFSWMKIGWVVLLIFIGFFAAFIFMDVTPDSGTIYYIAIVYGWIFLPGVWLTDYIFSSLFPQISGSQLGLGGTLSWIPLLINILWYYFLVCLILFIIRKFKKINL